MKQVAIVGGGISGLYLAWRLKDRKDLAVTLYEREPTVGGRLLTAPLSADGLAPLPAELGAMRFTDRHLFLRRLIGADSTESAPDCLSFDKARTEYPTAYYLRGRALHQTDFVRNAFGSTGFPYRLSLSECGKTPIELVAFVIWHAVSDCVAAPDNPPNAHFQEVKSKLVRLLDRILAGQHYARTEELTPPEWDTFKAVACLAIPAHARGGASDSGIFDHVRITHIGFWNLLKHYLTDEGFDLVNDGFGFVSVIANWNAGEAIRWCAEDYSPNQAFFSVARCKTDSNQRGFGGVAQKLRELLKGVTLCTGHQLESITCPDATMSGFTLSFENQPTASCEALVLALPPRALDRVRFKNLRPESGRALRQLVNSSMPHRMVKVILLYDEPWWKFTELPGAETGRVFSDVPERQLYYFGPRWLSKAGFDSQGRGVLMVYNDSRFTEFWRPFSEKARDDLWTDGSGDCANCFHRMPEPKGIADSRLVAEWRLVDKVTKQLRDLHSYAVPEPSAAVWKDWSDVGAWHTWRPHVDIGSAVRRMAQFAGPDLPLYVCGEAFSDEQGWVEGALKSAEGVARRLKCERWQGPSDADFTKAGHESYEVYMRNYRPENGWPK